MQLPPGEPHVININGSMQSRQLHPELFGMVCLNPRLAPFYKETL